MNIGKPKREWIEKPKIQPIEKPIAVPNWPIKQPKKEPVHVGL